MANDETSSRLVILYDILFSLVILLGVIINRKLFKTVANEVTGERGKVFQTILKNYALAQSIGWPLIWIWFVSLGHMDIAYGHSIPACIYVNSMHLAIFVYSCLRTHVGLTSLILAIGRYIYVVHDRRVLNWGVEFIGKILIRSSLIIPLLMAILSNSVITLEYNGWISRIKEYETPCYIKEEGYHNSTAISDIKVFKLGLYNIVHEIFPSWFTSGLYILHVVLTSILYSNITEGVIYAKAALFVYRYG